MNLIIRIQTTDKQGHVVKERSLEIENFKNHNALFSVIKAWVFETTLRLKQK